MQPALARVASLASLAVLSAAALALPREARAGDKAYSVAELKEAAPDAVAADVRGVLAKAGVRVANPDGKPVCDLWLRAELPTIAKFSEQLDRKYPIEPGTLVGVIRFPVQYSDYRKQNIKPGVYTLRYGMQPKDGNHLGTADFRDFLILGPAGDDKSTANESQDAAMERSKKASGTTHPSIMSLLPPQPGRDKLPAMIQDKDRELEILTTKATVKKDGKVAELPVELVAVGHFPE